MTLSAGDALRNMRHMTEARMIGQVINLCPSYRYALRVSGTQVLNILAIASDFLMTLHTSGRIR